MKYLLILFIFAINTSLNKAGDEFYDNRCICLCPSFKVLDQNISDTGRNVYIDILPKDKCSCENVLITYKPDQKEMLEQFCTRCTCNYETRNTTTMKVVVIIIICILVLLTIYMGFLLCLDPLMNRYSSRQLYLAQRNEDIDMSNEARTPDVDDQPFSTSHSRSNVINRVTQEQSKWKRQVQKQRSTVYDKHTLLN